MLMKAEIESKFNIDSVVKYITLNSYCKVVKIQVVHDCLKGIYKFTYLLEKDDESRFWVDEQYLESPSERIDI